MLQSRLKTRIKEEITRPRIGSVPMNKTLRPGPGWNELSPEVYEHSSGVRIHLLGFTRFPNGQYLSATRWSRFYPAAHRMILINGGNIKRGLMAWALAAYYKSENNDDHYKNTYLRD